MVSILIPVYNVEQYLPQCLNSVTGQSREDLQIVLIDDGSLDGSLAVCQEYAARDGRIEVYHQENQGVAATRNHLLEKVRGDYVLFVDADDWIELDMVECLLLAADKYSADMVSCESYQSTQIRSDKGCVDVWTQEKAVLEFLRHKCFNGSLWNKLIKSSLIRELSFNPLISYGEDALFIWNVLQKSKTIVVTDWRLYHYRMNNHSISHEQYGKKKMSGHLVWEQISQETNLLWPEYTDVSKATFAISDMWQLYFAAQSNYPKDDNIRIFQQNVRNHLWLIFHSGLINHKKMLFALVSSYSYRACKIIR